jgi:hypothetical protein
MPAHAALGVRQPLEVERRLSAILPARRATHATLRDPMRRGACPLSRESGRDIAGLVRGQPLRKRKL